MRARGRPAGWRALTPGQRAMLLRLHRDGPLVSLAPWEMRTIRSLLARGLVRPRMRGGSDIETAGLWFLSGKGERALPRAAADAGGAEARTGP